MFSLTNKNISAVSIHLFSSITTVILAIIFIDIARMEEKIFWSLLLGLLISVYLLVSLFAFVKVPKTRIPNAYQNIFTFSVFIAGYLYLSKMHVPVVIYLVIIVSTLRLGIWVVKGK